MEVLEMAPSKKSVSVGVMNRILKVLHEQSPIKITNLAMSSGLNYNTCKRYLHLMKIFGWIETSSKDNVTLAIITEAGRRIYVTLNDQ